MILKTSDTRDAVLFCIQTKEYRPEYSDLWFLRPCFRWVWQQKFHCVPVTSLNKLTVSLSLFFVSLTLLGTLWVRCLILYNHTDCKQLLNMDSAMKHIQISLFMLIISSYIVIFNESIMYYFQGTQKRGETHARTQMRNLVMLSLPCSVIGILLKMPYP